jgi:hypothetical protein
MKPLYHGTDADITDAVKPADSLGRKANYGLRTIGGRRAGTQAFATHDENYAWEAARVSSKAHGGRARVYEVAPHPDQKPGLYNAQHPRFKKNAPRSDLQEQVAPSFPVKDRIDIKPGHQGTFPNLNWRQFARANTAVGPEGYEDANHPSPEDERHGHGGGQMRRDHLEHFYTRSLDDSQHHRDLQAIKDMQADRAAGRKQGELF